MEGSNALVGQHMHSKALVFTSGSTLKDAVDQLLANNATGAAVIDDSGHVIGFLSERDCIGHILQAAYHQETMPTVDEVMVCEVTTVSTDDSLLDVAQLMIHHPPKMYPVTFAGKYVGVITRQSVLAELMKSFDVVK